MSELNDTVKATIEQLSSLIREFVQAQKELEIDAWAIGSNFINRWRSIRDRIAEFQPVAEGVVAATLAYMSELEVELAGEWDVLTLMTFLDPYRQWVPGQTCSPERFDCIREVLSEWVDQGIRADMTPREAQELDPHDYSTYIASTPTDLLSAEAQIAEYLHRRTSGRPKWQVDIGGSRDTCGNWPGSPST